MTISAAQLAKAHEILRQMDQRFAGGVVAENRRTANRLTVRLSLMMVPLAGTEPAAVPIVTRNISSSGIGFVSRRVFQKDERMAMSLKIPGMPGKLVLARSTYGKYVSGGMYEMGAEFLECIADPRGDAHIPSHWKVPVVVPQAGAEKTSDN